ncbi:Uncharacterised protein [Mycobacteroides abscessus subsp. abscessus]|nr:Uncharacterised protein [Mycobacteroides abscessus subsp. abscessus]
MLINDLPAFEASKAILYRLAGASTVVPPASLTVARLAGSVRSESIWRSPSLGCRSLGAQRTCQLPAVRNISRRPLYVQTRFLGSCQV